jgi:hypothetical protein
MRTLLALLLWCFVSLPALADNPAYETPEDPQPERTSAVNFEAPARQEKWHLEPSLSVISPREFTLTQDSYSIPYGKNLAGLPAVYVGAGNSLGTYPFGRGSLEVFSLMRLGYSYKETLMTLNERSGRVKLHWVPMEAGIETRFRLAAFPFIRPSLTVGGGVHWLYQSGEFPSINSSFWVPHLFITPALSFFESFAPTDWFGGFTFGATYQHSLAAKQIIRAWSFDLGITIIL